MFSAAQGALAYLIPAALCARRHCVRKPRLSAPQACPSGAPSSLLRGKLPTAFRDAVRHSPSSRQALRSEISADDDSPNVGCFLQKMPFARVM